MLKSIKENIYLILIILISTFLILFYSNQKINFNVDELLTYSLSNGSSTVNPVPGEKYESYEEFQKSFLTPSHDTRFDYSNVWKNQTNDVHPPFYYAIIHTINSFCPDYLSKYIGISVNLFFNMLIIILLYRLTLIFTNDKRISYIASLFWAVNPGVIQDNLLIRMYVMVMFFSLLLSYVHLKKIKGLFVKDINFYLSILLISTAGILTHYYFLIFSFFLCGLYSVFLLVKKKYKDIFAYVGTYILTFIGVWMTFPAIYVHLFGGVSRGGESIENLKSKNGYIDSLQVFWKLLDENIFGGYLFVSIIFIVALTIFYLIKNNFSFESKKLFQIGFLILPSILFFLLVSKIAVYKAERYIQLIFPIVILMFVIILFTVLRKYFYNNNNTATFISSLILCVMILNGHFQTCSFEYLNSNSKDALELSKRYKAKDSIYIYKSNWKVQTSFMELKQYNSVTFVMYNNLELLNKNLDYDEFVLYIDPSIENEKEILKYITDASNNIDTYTKLYNYAYSNVYYFK